MPGKKKGNKKKGAGGGGGSAGCAAQGSSMSDTAEAHRTQMQRDLDEFESGQYEMGQAGDDADAPAVRVEEHPTKGRVLIATDFFKPGDVIFKEKAFVAASWNDFHCIECMKPHRPARCPHVQQRYSRVLRENLGALEEAMREVEEIGELDRARAFIKVMHMVRANPDSRAVHEFLQLATHKPQECLDCVAKLRKRRLVRTTQAIPDELSDVQAALILSVLNCNSHQIEDVGGSAVFLTASMMEHSCVPNCNFVTQGCHIFVVCIAPVSPGDPLAIDYNQAFYRPTAVRQAALLKSHGFLCSCPGCTTLPDRCRAFNCPEAVRNRAAAGMPPLGHGGVVPAAAGKGVQHQQQPLAPHMQQQQQHQQGAGRRLGRGGKRGVGARSAVAGMDDDGDGDGDEDDVAADPLAAVAAESVAADAAAEANASLPARAPRPACLSGVVSPVGLGEALADWRCLGCGYQLTHEELVVCLEAERRHPPEPEEEEMDEDDEDEEAGGAGMGDDDEAEEEEEDGREGGQGQGHGGRGGKSRARTALEIARETATAALGLEDGSGETGAQGEGHPGAFVDGHGWVPGPPARVSFPRSLDEVNAMVAEGVMHESHCAVFHSMLTLGYQFAKEASAAVTGLGGDGAGGAGGAGMGDGEDDELKAALAALGPATGGKAKGNDKRLSLAGTGVTKRRKREAYRRAERVWLRVIAAAQRVLPRNHPDKANYLDALAQVYVTGGNLTGAQRAWKAAYELSCVSSSRRTKQTLQLKALYTNPPRSIEALMLHYDNVRSAMDRIEYEEDAASAQLVLQLAESSLLPHMSESAAKDAAQEQALEHPQLSDDDGDDDEEEEDEDEVDEDAEREAESKAASAAHRSFFDSVAASSALARASANVGLPTPAPAPAPVDRKTQVERALPALTAALSRQPQPQPQPQPQQQPVPGRPHGLGHGPAGPLRGPSGLAAAAGAGSVFGAGTGPAAPLDAGWGAGVRKGAAPTLFAPPPPAPAPAPSPAPAPPAAAAGLGIFSGAGGAAPATAAPPAKGGLFKGFTLSSSAAAVAAFPSPAGPAAAGGAPAAGSHNPFARLRTGAAAAPVVFPSAAAQGRPPGWGS